MRVCLKLVRRWFSNGNWNDPEKMPKIPELKSSVHKIVYDGDPSALDGVPTPETLRDLLLLESHEVFQTLFAGESTRIVDALLAQADEVSTSEGNVNFLNVEMTKLLNKVSAADFEEEGRLMLRLVQDPFLLNMALKNDAFVEGARSFLEKIDPHTSLELQNSLKKLFKTCMGSLEIDTFKNLAKLYPFGEDTDLLAVTSLVETEFQGYFVSTLFLQQLLSWLEFVEKHQRLPIVQSHTQRLAAIFGSEIRGEELTAIVNPAIRKLTCDVFYLIYKALPDEQKAAFLEDFANFSKGKEALSHPDGVFEGVEAIKAQIVSVPIARKKLNASKLPVSNKLFGSRRNKLIKGGV
jgi:hypothetical protein